MVSASNVTLQNVRVLPTDNSIYGIQQQPSAPNLTVRDSEIIAIANAPTQYGISQSVAGLTVSRVLIRNVDSGIHLGAGSVTVTNSRIDQLTGTGPVGIGSNGDTPNLNFSNNTILVNSDAGEAIALLDGPYQGVIIDGNVLAGGGFALLAGAQANSNNIKITNNRFSRMYYPNCGFTGPVDNYDPSEPGNQWSGNVWADTGQPVDHN
jgi:Right handed beta helix region